MANFKVGDWAQIVASDIPEYEHLIGDLCQIAVVNPSEDLRLDYLIWVDEEANRDRATRTRACYSRDSGMYADTNRAVQRSRWVQPTSAGATTWRTRSPLSVCHLPH